MTDLTQMIRWKAGFVRGLAQSVLARAKNIREALDKSEKGAAARKKKAGAKSSRRKSKKKHE